jgi:hypothetical protein
MARWIGDGDLEGGIHRLRAGVGEEHMVEIAGQHGREPGGQLEGEGVAHLEGGREIHPADLVAHGLDDLLAAVAGIDAPQAGGAVEDLAVVVGGVVHAFRAHEQARLALELPVVGEGHPEGFEIVRGGVEIRDVDSRGHDGCPISGRVAGRLSAIPGLDKSGERAVPARVKWMKESMPS